VSTEVRLMSRIAAADIRNGIFWIAAEQLETSSLDFFAD
jgi:hypothetical protein